VSQGLHAAGIPILPNPVMWATYLTSGLQDIQKLRFGMEYVRCRRAMRWPGAQDRRVSGAGTIWLSVSDLSATHRSVDTVKEEYLALLIESVRLRFRSDVPVAH